MKKIAQKKIKYLIFNWKSGVDLSYLNFFFHKIKQLPLSNLNFLIICPTIYLHFVFQKKLHSNISLFAQDFVLNDAKDLIGITNLSMLKDFCNGVLVNHWKNEIEQKDHNRFFVKQKLEKVVQNNFQTILCLNNLKYHLHDIELFFKYLEEKIVFFFNDLSHKQQQQIIIVFEIFPKLIEKVSDQKIAAYVEIVLAKIKNFCLIKYQITVPVLFGTNLKNTNLPFFETIKSLDGFIFGRQSYNRKNFFDLLKKYW